MKLIVWELGLDGTVLTQKYTTTKKVDLYAVRAHLLIFGDPAGTVTMKILDSDGKLVKASSDTHTITDLQTLSNSNKVIRFIFDVSLKADTEYTFELSTPSGYTYSATNLVGWCAHSELRRVPLTSGFQGGSIGEPKGLEFWTYAEKAKGVA